MSASLVLFFLADPIAALRAWRGLLVAGGRLGITTFAEQDERWQQIDAAASRFGADSGPLRPRQQVRCTLGSTGG